MILVGVDPGATGALAFVDQEAGALLAVVDMPAHDGVVSPALCADALGPWLVHHQLQAWVENVHSMPKQGVSSSFKFGRAFGVICGVLGGLRVPTHYVAPQVWKKAAGLSKDKGASRRRAIELWPSQSQLFARVKDDGRAEAALIALHGLQQQRQAVPA